MLGRYSLYFAHEVGKEGKVYSFEFVPSNLDVMNTTLDLSPGLKERTEIVMNPLWERSKEELYFSDHGPGTRVGGEKSKKDLSAITVSIDDYVEKNSIERIDFIRMDIEGAELNALKGAARTLRKFRPKLAISLYHRPSDFLTIPQFLSSLELECESTLAITQFIRKKQSYSQHPTTLQNES